MRLRLGDAREPLARTLQEMCGLPEELRPFCIVQEKASGRFVQFAGSQSRLLFDAPQLGVRAVHVPERSIPLAVDWAIGSMLKHHQLSPDTEVEIRFETTRPREGRS